jgi:hypothetical protein
LVDVFLLTVKYISSTHAISAMDEMGTRS